ncbi:MAG: hypothetical protein AAB332_04200 [Planctomycetota bacterium]
MLRNFSKSSTVPNLSSKDTTNLNVTLLCLMIHLRRLFARIEKLPLPVAGVSSISR